MKQTNFKKTKLKNRKQLNFIFPLLYLFLFISIFFVPLKVALGGIIFVAANQWLKQEVLK